jgi:hypothetical protein
VSPFAATATAAWIVGWSAGTLITAPAAYTGDDTIGLSPAASREAAAAKAAAAKAAAWRACGVRRVKRATGCTLGL